mmetsp:Transcript_16714/g.35901  ORF Transcript_16714/g.35901 Transcript_16714/m.35901 type:complete len:321 (-) Transcript_16714:164-1126(-)
MDFLFGHYRQAPFVADLGELPEVRAGDAHVLGFRVEGVEHSKRGALSEGRHLVRGGLWPGRGRGASTTSAFLVIFCSTSAGEVAGAAVHPPGTGKTVGHHHPGHATALHAPHLLHSLRALILDVLLQLCCHFRHVRLPHRELTESSVSRPRALGPGEGHAEGAVLLFIFIIGFLDRIWNDQFRAVAARTYRLCKNHWCGCATLGAGKGTVILFFLILILLFVFLPHGGLFRNGFWKIWLSAQLEHRFRGEPSLIRDGPFRRTIVLFLVVCLQEGVSHHESNSLFRHREQLSAAHETMLLSVKHQHKFWGGRCWTSDGYFE